MDTSESDARPTASALLKTPLGAVRITAGPHGLTGIAFLDQDPPASDASPPDPAPPMPDVASPAPDPTPPAPDAASQVVGAPTRAPDELLAAAAEQLAAYFAGTLRRFDLPLAPEGTPFQRAVWRLLQDVPYGTTTSYAALAARLGQPDASRAVGAANGRNPLAIVVPCHRVVGRDGALVGYAGGLRRKTALLALEAGQAGLPLG